MVLGYYASKAEPADRATNFTAAPPESDADRRRLHFMVA